MSKILPKQGKWPTWYYIAMEDGKPILRDGQVPIYWMKKVAVADFKDWSGAIIKRCRVTVSE